MSEISVLLCACRESPEEFEVAVRSVVLQTHAPKQIVIVDDSGYRRFSSHCQQLQDTLFVGRDIDLVYIGNTINKGLVASLNLGLESVACQYVARMDADDISLPYRFFEQIKLLGQGFDIVGGGVALFNDKRHLRDVRYPLTRLGVLCSLILNNPIAHPVSMFKAGIIRELGGYRQINYAEDLDLWMRAYLAGCRIVNHRQVLLLRRIHERQLSSEFHLEQKESAKFLRKEFIKKIKLSMLYSLK